MAENEEPERIWIQKDVVSFFRATGTGTYYRDPDANSIAFVRERADLAASDALAAFDAWWAERVKEGYQYGRGPLATVRFGFEAGFAAASRTAHSDVAAQARADKPRIYEPEDIGDLDEISDVVPNVEIIEDHLRLHFHKTGLSFGIVAPHDKQFSVCIPYEKARQIMLREATTVRDEKGK